jgi:putative peptide zinc metalloprotease protein
MTTLADGRSDPVGAATGTAAAVDVPVRADGVSMLGSHRGSGYRIAPALVQRADGQVLQLTPLLYAVLTAVDGTRTEDEIAAVVSAQVGRTVVADDVRTLIGTQLRPLGLLRRADGSEPEVRKANPLLALRCRYVVSDPERTRRLTAPFAALFHPVLVVLFTVAFAVVAYWVLFAKGLASAAHEAFARPGMLLAVFAITVVSAGFHEFGHAAALRRGGGTPGAMGAGLYLVWPAFYTDVTDAYRLDRRARLRTDLGGLYFNALVALAMFGIWALVGWDGLLLVIATQILQMIRQLPPLLRFDGYHVLADITGVPDLFHRIKPTLVSLWPTRWRSPEARMLKPWARLVITVWVLLVVPLLLLTALVTIVTLPRILATAGHSFAAQWSLLEDRWHAGDWLGVGAKVLALIAVALPVLGVSYIVARMVRQLVGSTLRRTRGKPVQRTLAAVLAAAIVAGLVWVWWPRGNYRAIAATERGTLAQAFAAAPASLVSPGQQAVTLRTLHPGSRVQAHTIWPKGTPLPAAGKPQLVMVLTPRDPSQPTWVFPFNRPAPPGPGGNQALAVATKNGSTVYDVAFALVTAASDTVLNRNEAYAFASCKRCTAVAISFQVVLIVGNAHVIAPQNISAAVGFNCVKCVTAALAIQLDVQLPGQLDGSTSARLTALWKRIMAFSKHLRSLSLVQIRNKITAYEKQILQILAPYAQSGAGPSGSSAPSAPSAVGSTAPAPTAPGAPAATGSATGSPVPGAPATPSTSAPVASTSAAPSSAPPSSAPAAPASSSGAP